MTQSSPTVSIIMPCYNGAEHIEEAVASVLAQNFKDWELLIVNDGSSDASAKLIDDFAATDARITAIHNPAPSGPAKARNVALKQAAGRYITFLDSDDAWYANKLTRQLEAFERTGAAVVFANYRTMDARSKRLGRVVCLHTFICRKTLFRGNPIGMLTGMYDTHKTGGVQLIPEDVICGEDWAMWFNLLNGQGRKAYRIPEFLADYRVHQSSLTANKNKALRKRWLFYREHLNLPLWQAAPCFGCYFVNGVLKTLGAKFWR